MRARHNIFSRMRTPQVVWIVSDSLAILPAFIIATFVRFGGDFSEATFSVGAIGPRAILFATLIVVGMFVTGMYRTRQRILPEQVLSHSAVSVAIGGFLNIVTYYLYPPISTGRGVLVIAMLFALIGITVTRRLFAPVAEKFIRRRRIVVVGAGRAAQKIAMRRRQSDLRQYEVVAYLRTPGDMTVNSGAPMSWTIDEISELHDTSFDEVVLALDERRGAIDAEALFEFRQRGVSVITLVDFLEREAGRVDIDIMDTAWFIFTEGCHARQSYLASKRFLDVVGSILLITLLFPVLFLVALALFIESRGREPVFYTQERVGLRGVPFQLVKFRSMCANAESDGPKWSSEGDIRITTVGRIIRRLRLDELPQLINIFRGEMSIVGPRPERPEFVHDLSAEIPMYEYRHLVKPGLAGWAQLSFPYGESVSDAREKLKYDLYYIKNAATLMDFFILAQTLEVVIWGQGVSMSGRSSTPHAYLPSARLPNWRPQPQEAESARK